MIKQTMTLTVTKLSDNELCLVRERMGVLIRNLLPGESGLDLWIPVLPIREGKRINGVDYVCEVIQRKYSYLLDKKYGNIS